MVARFDAQARPRPRGSGSFTVGHEPRTEVVEALADWSGGRAPCGVRRAAGRQARVGSTSSTTPSPVPRRSRSGCGYSKSAGRSYSPECHTRAIRVDAHLLQGAHSRRLERLRSRRGRGRPQARHRPLPGPAVDGRVDLTGMVTHRFPLTMWWDALLAMPTRISGAIKVAFESRGAEARYRCHALTQNRDERACSGGSCPQAGHRVLTCLRLPPSRLLGSRHPSCRAASRASDGNPPRWSGSRSASRASRAARDLPRSTPTRTPDRRPRRCRLLRATCDRDREPALQNLLGLCEHLHGIVVQEAVMGKGDALGTAIGETVK